MRYNNYHRHDHYSNVRTPDVIVKPQDYIDRILELGHDTYFTTNHGCSGNVLEAYDMCKENNLKLIYGMEMYYTDDRHSKEGNTYHIVVVGLTKNAYKQINKISSLANTEGFYYKPRVDLELLLTLPNDEVVVTTACIAGRLFKTENYIEEFVLPLKNHFRNNFMLETQDHNHEAQADWNKKILELSNKLDIPIIHGCDSHYIYPEQSSDRMKFLKGKGMNYGDEDSFILDYPDSDTIFDRYKEQGILTEEQVKSALENTHVFDKAEDLGFEKEIKMPSIYEGDSNKELKKIVAKKWKEEKNNVDQNMLDKYKKEIKFEMDIIEKTSMADYFLLNEKIIDRAVNEYGAVLSRTGRGSAPSFFINKLLGFTDIDRIDAEVPLYATRFMSVARILQTRSMVDIDFNFSDIKPVVKASKDILGEDGIYYMVAYGKMKESAAFRNLCRSYEMEMHEYNEVAKNLEEYEYHDKWGEIIEESKKYIGVIDSISPSPCSFLLLDKPITEEIGLIKVGDEICASIDGYTADVWKYLKNDYLTVSVWKLISDTFKLLDKPIPSIKELKTLLDDSVWDLYSNGITSTLNQADSEFATQLIKKYEPRSIAEMSAFVAAIRPGFASLLNHFLNREEYSTGVEELDVILEDSFQYLLYQESLMKFFMWCGIEEDYTYDIIKKIAKKKFEHKELVELKSTLLKGFEKNTGGSEGFDDVWRVVEDAAAYSFNASHSLSVSYDSLYGAYLKANYPLEYYTVVLNHYEHDTEKTKNIVSELKHFGITLHPIKFRYSGAEYTMDKKNNSIYQGVASLKYLNEQVAENIHNLRDNEYKDFYDLLQNIKGKGVNSKQLTILISLGFFSEFGKNKKLLDFVEKFDLLHGKKQMSKKKAIEKNLDIDLLIKYSRETEKTYMDLQVDEILKEELNNIENKSLSLKDQVQTEMDHLNYILFTEPRASKDFYIVSEYKVYKNKAKPYITLYRLKDGQTMKTKVKDDKTFMRIPFEHLSVIKVNKFKEERKNKLVDGKWIKSEETEQVLKEWEVIQK